MWFYLIALAVILGSLSGIGAIVGKKFPQLSLIDTEALPMERDAKKKKEIMHDRVSRMTGAFGRRLGAALTAVFEDVQERFRGQYRRLLTLDQQYKGAKKAPVKIEDQAKMIAALFETAKGLRDAGEYGNAEKRYIEVLTLDRKNHDAYWGLGELYIEAKKYEQATETFAYLVRMVRKTSRCTHAEAGAPPSDKPCEASSAAHAEIAAGWFETALAAQASGDVSATRSACERSVAFEPANPRHLDLLLETCITGGDKARAVEVLQMLREANPENNKIVTLADRIEALPEHSALPAQK